MGHLVTPKACKTAGKLKEHAITNFNNFYSRSKKKKLHQNHFHLPFDNNSPKAFQKFDIQLNSG